MKLYSNKTKNHGFTLIEMLATMIILGVIAAIAAPNLLGMIRRQQVNNAITIINGAVKETQRQAIRQAVSCDLTINTVAETITATPTNPASDAICLSEVRSITNDGINNDSLDVRNNLNTPDTIRFSAKGNTTSGGTIIVSSEETLDQRCFVISNGLGITRTGIWNPTSPTGGPADKIGFDGSCDSNQ
ncbi:MAG: type II secretion system protein [Cyanobacteria bacterium P01_F01_bin.143]